MALRLTTLLLTVAAGFFAACNDDTPETKREESSSAQTKAFIKDYEARLDRFSESIATLQRDMENAGAETREDLQQEVADLTGRKAELEKRIEQLEGAREAEVERMRSEIRDQWQGLEEDLADARRKLQR